jgi:hypothetical protein
MCRVLLLGVPLSTVTGRPGAGDRRIERGRSPVEAFGSQRSGDDGHVDPQTTEPTRDVRTLDDVELDRRIRAGWDVWCDLVDDLVSTAGMLPSRELAGRVAGFFEDAYWRAEDARVEALRRQLDARDLRRCHTTERSGGIR